MSTTTNTIKLSSDQGDLYINSQQTLAYKGLTLFGYGYLDWGTIVNQSIVDLIDKIDKLQDSGFSEIQFDLNNYEENQKILRTQEFTDWKVNFKGVLQELIQTYIDTTSTAIEEFKTAQETINEETTKLIQDNYKTLDSSLTELSDTLDERIITQINELLGSINTTIENLSQKVDKSSAALDAASQTLNAATEEVKQLIESFKTEFSKVFETFKTDTGKALDDNKDYLVKYIDQKITGVNTTSNSLEDRISSLEMISDSLNPSYIQTLITNKVTSISEGVITTYLADYEKRLSAIEADINDLNANLTKTIISEVDLVTSEIKNTVDAQTETIKALSDKVTTVEKTIDPLNVMKLEIENEYSTVDNFVQIIGETEFNSLDSKVIIGGLSRGVKSIIKNVLTDLINQEKTNTTNFINFINSSILNLTEGLRFTSFDELSLIKRHDLKQTLINSYFDFVKSNIENYSQTEFKFNGLFSDIGVNKIDFSFSLPNITQTNTWGIGGLEILNTRTNERIESSFLFSDGFISNKLLEFYKDTYPVDGNVPIEQINQFSYYTLFNTSGIVTCEFHNGLLETDNIKISVYSNSSNSTKIGEQTIAVSEFMKNGAITENWKTGNYINLYKTNLDLVKPIINSSELAYNNQDLQLVIPTNRIGKLKDGSSIFSIKICLPVGATLTKIEFNDEFTTSTKTFVNQPNFPISELDYTTRKLSETNNYYTDIGTTGQLVYPINSNSTAVKTVITYVIDGVTKTFETTTSGSGNSKNKIITATIGNGAFYDLNVTTIFSAGTDSVNVTVDPRVLETTQTSDVVGKYIKADNLCSIVWIDSSTIRVYNEYSESLSFQFLLRS